MEKIISPDFTVGAWRYYKRPAFASLYAVAGRFISVESSDREFADLFRHYYSGWYVTSIRDTENVRPDATILVNSTIDPPVGLPHLKSFEVAEGGACRTDTRNYFFEHHGSAVRAGDEYPPQVEVWVGKNAQARERAALARLIFNASMTAMRRCGLFELHAAGVVEPNGTGVLIIGPSGSGKSTLATKLASAGWQYLSDDSLLLYTKSEMVEARALRRVFGLSENTFSASGIERLKSIPSETQPFDPLKKRFEPHSVFPDKFTEVCVPAKLFFSRITEETTSRTQPLSQGETMARLIRMCPWACYDKPAAQAHLSVLAQLARQARGYELHAGADLFGDADYSSHLLSRTS